MPTLLTRREAIAAAALSITGAAGLAAQGRHPLPVSSARTRAIRLAHLTDTHIQPELRATEGVTACLRHMRAQDDPPELVVTGGDLIMDAFEQPADRTRALWDLWVRTLRDECPVPVEHCLGNHDIWGWNRRRSGTSGDEARWGKRWAVDALGLPGPYRSFDRAGWHFVILDSTHPDPNDADGYIAQLDPEQHAWLESDLARVPAGVPIVVVSHIPILSAIALLANKEDVALERNIPAGLMHTDAKRLVNLFLKHPGVKLCLGGHLHQLDRIDYQGVSYLCGGAVSGSWWKGRHRQCDEGYGLVDLYTDGTFEHRYQTYGWKAEQG